MMKTLGEKIRELRNAIGMTQNELAEELGIALKTLQRYENERSRPDYYALAKLATFFDVPADYLLGICNYEMETNIARKKPNNYYYKKYIECRTNYTIDKEAIYYCIYSNENDSGGITQFDGWLDKAGKKERRTLRPVKPEKFIELCSGVFGTIMVLNSREDVYAFFIYGGYAVIRKDICEKYAPWYLEDYIVEQTEPAGLY